MSSSLLAYYAVGVAAVLSASLVMFRIVAASHRTMPNWPLYGLLILSAYLVPAQFFMYHSYRFYADFSHWAQIIYNISKTWTPECWNQEFLKPGFLNYFSAHFAPLLYLFAVPFKLLPRIETVIGINLFLMFSAAIPLYKLALFSTKDRQFALFTSVLLLLYPTFQYTVLHEFGVLRFSIPIILWALYFNAVKNTAGYFLCVVLAVLVREEVGLTVFMYGVYLVLFEKQRRNGTLTALIGLGGFVVITQLIMPAFRGAAGSQHVAAHWFRDFGNKPLEIIWNMIANPSLTMSVIFQADKMANVFMFFLPLLFIPLLSPAVLLSVAANFGMVLISVVPTAYSYMFYYLSPSLPFIFYAFIKGWPRFERWLGNMPAKRGLASGGRTTQVAMATVLAGFVTANIFFGASPVSLQFWSRTLRPAPFKTKNFHYSAYKISERHRVIDEFYRIIPDSAVVSTQQFLSPRLFKNPTMVFPKLKHGDIDAEYVLFDKTNNGLDKISTAYKTQAEFDLVEKEKRHWKLFKAKDGFYLYKRFKVES